MGEGPPSLFDTKISPRRPKSSPWLPLGHSQWSFGALFVRLGMLWWRWVLSSRFLLIFGGLLEVPGWSLCSSNIINNEVCSRSPFFVFWSSSDVFLDAFWWSLGSLGLLLGSFWLPWVALGRLLGPSWLVLEVPGRSLGSFLEVPRLSGGAFGSQTL